VYLSWLKTRIFESQVAAGLAVLLCAEREVLPSFFDVKAAINKPSILADLLLQHIYGFGNRKAGWLEAHSGVAPDDFEAGKFFEDHKTAHVPLILSNHMQRLEEKYGLPFVRQWGFEWRQLMNDTGSPYSDFPYHFVGNLLRSNVVGQFDLAQSDVMRSAYLRTLALAVSKRVMTAQQAGFYSLDCLPLNRDLLRLRPIDRPEWLSDIPEQCCGFLPSLEVAARKLAAERAGMRPVSLHIPIKASLYEFGDLSITAIMATDDFAPVEDDERYFSRDVLWPLPDGLSFSGPVDEEDPANYLSTGRTGSSLPICLKVVPLPFGYWHGDYLQVGLALPASYNFPTCPEVSCGESGIVLSCDGEIASTLLIWHDHWTPLYAKDGGDTRCGVVTNMRSDHLARALEHHRMQLGWVIQLRIWSRPSDHGEYVLSNKREFFFD
jgi:hypothetical protein